MVDARFHYRIYGEAATDYDRVCDVETPLGVLPVGPGHGLVLGSLYEISAAWLTNPRHGGPTLVRCEWAEDQASEDQALADWMRACALILYDFIPGNAISEVVLPATGTSRHQTFREVAEPSLTQVVHSDADRPPLTRMLGVRPVDVNGGERRIRTSEG